MQVKAKDNHSLGNKIMFKSLAMERENQHNSHLLFQIKYKFHILLKKISTLWIKSPDIQGHKLETHNLLKTITFIEKCR